MPPNNGLSELPLLIIARRCAEESDHFYSQQSYDPLYCFEIFRRAILERDDTAWEQVYTQYRPQLIRWVSRHSSFAGSGEDIDYFINRALEKMWTAIPPVRFEKFADLKSLLRYLQLCTYSVLLDHSRLLARTKFHQQVDLEIAERQSLNQPPERPSVGHVAEQDFWVWLGARMKDEKEQKVLYGSFVLDLKPREIFDHYNQLFSNVNEVYRLKENILARLRRDTEITAYLQGDA
jgi:DNA-directed RNA polymerase specialized sigma24 family protein